MYESTSRLKDLMYTKKHTNKHESERDKRQLAVPIMVRLPSMHGSENKVPLEMGVPLFHYMCDESTCKMW